MIRSSIILPVFLLLLVFQIARFLSLFRSDDSYENNMIDPVLLESDFSFAMNKFVYSSFSLLFCFQSYEQIYSVFYSCSDPLRIYEYSDLSFPWKKILPDWITDSSFAFRTCLTWTRYKKREVMADYWLPFFSSILKFILYLIDPFLSYSIHTVYKGKFRSLELFLPDHGSRI